MSFHDVAITVRAENRASAEFNKISADATRMSSEVKAAGDSMATGLKAASEHARETTVNMSRLATSISTIGYMSSYFLMLASDIGIADKESSKHVRTMIHMITVTSYIVRLKYYLMGVTKASTAAQTANATAVATNTAAQHGSSIAMKIRAAASLFAAKCQAVFNSQLAATLVLTGVGIATVIAAAAAMAYFASQTKSAADSVRDYNRAVEEAPTHTRSIRRAGEEDLRRRGIE